MSKISHVLLKNPIIVPTGTRLSEAAQLINNKIASLLVSQKGILAGIVSMEDIVHSIANGEQDITVDDVMHSPYIAIDSDKWLTDAIEMFMQYNISHITVVEKGDKVGIIRAEDILHTYRFGSEHYG